MWLTNYMAITATRGTVTLIATELTVRCIRSAGLEGGAAPTHISRVVMIEKRIRRLQSAVHTPLCRGVTMLRR